MRQATAERNPTSKGQWVTLRLRTPSMNFCMCKWFLPEVILIAFRFPSGVELGTEEAWNGHIVCRLSTRKPFLCT